MSGSPIYIDGRLAGAVAYNLGGFGERAIGGVTPIAEMLPILEGRSADTGNQTLRSSLDDTQLGDPQLDDTHLDDPHLDDTQLDGTQLDDTHLGDPQLDDTHLDDTQLDWRRPLSARLFADLQGPEITPIQTPVALAVIPSVDP